jgi:hypothetical protein
MSLSSSDDSDNVAALKRGSFSKGAIVMVSSDLGEGLFLLYANMMVV